VWLNGRVGRAAAPPPDDVRSRVAHLYRRAAFGLHADELDAAAAGGYDAAVDHLLDLSGPDTGADTAAGSPPALTSPTVTGTPDPKILQAEVNALGVWWVQRMASSTTPLRERLVLFWHGHFATSVQKVRIPALMLRQNEIFRTQGSSNFEALAQAVAKDPSMLLWLDANQNRRQSPNENFARELFELFTLGIGNYTEDDVKNSARAFTGWQYQRARDTFAVAPAFHDDGIKTVLGQTGAFGGEDVIRLATHHPAGPPFVVSKLWSHFARPATPSDPVVKDLAAGFAKDLDVGRLLAAMFRHPEFVAPASRTGLVKEPIAYVAGTLRALGLRADGRGLNVVNVLTNLGQQPFAPPNVGGWPQNGYWLTTSFALARLRFAASVAQRADVQPLAAAPPADRPAAAARLLSVDGWGATTSAALAKVADDPRSLLTLALVAPEYLLA
jgi:uncharacterized protein (DUF1800 family)